MQAHAVDAHLIAGQVAVASSRIADAMPFFTRAHLPAAASRTPSPQGHARSCTCRAASWPARPGAVTDPVRSRRPRWASSGAPLHRAARTGVRARRGAGSARARRPRRQPAGRRVLEWMERTRAAALSVIDAEPLQTSATTSGSFARSTPSLWPRVRRPASSRPGWDSANADRAADPERDVEHSCARGHTGALFSADGTTARTRRSRAGRIRRTRWRTRGGGS